MRSQPSWVEPLRPEWPSCMHIFALEWAWQNSTMRLKASRWTSFHRPVSSRGNARLGRRAGHLDVDQARPADGAAAEMDEVPVARHAVDRGYWSIGDTTTRFSSTMSRRRNGVNIGTGGSSSERSKP